MAEEIRSIKEILEELFKGSDSAIEKYAKVRHTQYEIMLWKRYGLPLREVDKGAKAYFSKRFLKGARIEKVDRKTLEAGLDSLNHAINDGCHKRCLRLVNELNEALVLKGLEALEENLMEGFLN